MKKNQYKQIFVSSPAASFYYGAYFGEGSGPIFVDDLQCEDNSTHINNCSYVTYDNCYHFNDVSVICTGKSNKQLEISKLKIRFAKRKQFNIFLPRAKK
jgi:hypothetical protein